MVSPQIKNVLVVGASGSVGSSTIKALLDEGFQVTGLTRESSTAVLPAGVRHLKSDFTASSLADVFKGQDAIVSTISSITPGGALGGQKDLVDAAISAGVKVFVPSEFGIDTADPSASTFIPFLSDKIETLNYLKSNEDKISWTAVITGSMFDWGLNIPGFGGWNVPARTVTIFDGGDVSFEATNLAQVGRAIAKCFKKPNLTKNQYVYINSFTITQNEVLRALENATDDNFEVSHSTVEELWESGSSQVNEGQPLGVLAMIAGAVYGKGGLGNFSVTKGLWNGKLDLPQENLEQFVKEYITNK